jgi:S1-C subfamily serine protease
MQNRVMKLNRFAWMLVIFFLEATAFQLHAQQTVTATNETATATNNFEKLEAQAEAGDAAAQFGLGSTYYEKIGEKVSFMNRSIGAAPNQADEEWDVQAYKWLCLAAAQTNFSLATDARTHLAVVVIRMDSDQLEKAKELVRKEAPDADAKVEADVAAYNHDNFIFAKSAAKIGNPYFQNVLANDYALGIGVSKDDVEAAKWYRRSAMQGDSFGEESMGRIYETGTGVPQDYVQAYKWFNLAAAQGFVSSDVYFAFDFGVAHQAAAIAIQGFEPAQKNRDEIAQKITSDQIAEAQRLSDEFKPRKESGSDNSTSSENPTASGSGFFITGDGYLISNYHVVKEATKVRLVTSAGTVDAKVVQVDAANDLALLKADGKFSPLPIAASRSAHLGGTVATIGFPDPTLQGFSPKLAKGEIASLSGAGDDPRYFQISVPVQPGNSGGALVDEFGNVIGIVSAKLDASVALAASGALPENVNYAVKSSLLLSFLESVPDVSAKLKAPNTADEKFSDVVKSAQDAAVLVLVY